MAYLIPCERKGCANQFTRDNAIVGFRFPIGKIFFCSKECFNIVKEADQ